MQNITFFFFPLFTCLFISTQISTSPFNDPFNNPYNNQQQSTRITSGNGTLYVDESNALKDLHFNGVATLKNSNIEKNVHVNGYLRADNSTIRSLSVNGKATISNCIIQKETQVNGSFWAEASTFHDLVSISSEKVTFIECTIAAIEMREIGKKWVFWGSTTQIVKLKHGSKIQGTIFFEQGDGEVWLYDPNCTCGNVIGGKIIRKY